MLILVRGYVLYRRTVRRYPSVAALLWAYIDRKWHYWARLGLADRVPLLHVITALVQSELKVEDSTGREQIIVVTYIFFSLLCQGILQPSLHCPVVNPVKTHGLTGTTTAAMPGQCELGFIESLSLIFLRHV